MPSPVVHADADLAGATSTERFVAEAEQLFASSLGGEETIRRVARLVAAEERARLRVVRMQEITAAMSSARTAREVADAACCIGVQSSDAVAAMLWVLEEDGSLVLVGTFGVPEPFMAQFRTIPADAQDSPALRIVRTGEPAWVETEDDYRRLSPEILEKAKLAGRVLTFGAVPLSVAGKVLGLVSYSHPPGHVFDEDERRFLVAVAQHCAQALDRARLLDSERQANERLRLLADAGETLALSLDLEESLRSLARLAVPAFADWCAIDLVQGEELRRVATAHKDPAKARAAEAVARRYPSSARAVGKAAVIADGKARFYPRLTPEVVTQTARDAEELAFMNEQLVLSAIILPLKIGGGPCIGSIAFSTAESRRIYRERDFHFAEELGRRANQAITNAHLYRAAQDAARRAAEERWRAEEANRIKDEFLATVSHELRNPLNAITGWSALLLRQPHDATMVAKGLEVIRRNAEAQTRIVEDVLDVSRIVTGKLKIDVVPVDMVAVARAALDVVRPQADARGVALTFNTSSEDRCRLAGDAARLQQVAVNLLSNAIKFTGAGGVVDLRVERDGPTVMLTVQDSGRGIEPDFLPLVFERFRQADSSTTRTYGGLGLGLAIVRDLVELHGGQVSARSAGAGRGATFEVVLPVRAVSMSLFPQESSAAPGAVRPPGAASLRGVRILVVDNDGDAREIVEAVLVEEGAIVETASSAQGALLALERFRPDVLVSDIGMPGEDGYELIRQVRARPASGGGDVPAVALTAYARPEDRARVLASGYGSHLAKPVDATELVLVIGSLRR